MGSDGMATAPTLAGLGVLAGPAAGPGGTGGLALGRGGSAWRKAHCGWMPAREYTVSWQTGQRARVEAGGV
jgi:hypothetical protein